jgi:hypothetical protein
MRVKDRNKNIFMGRFMQNGISAFPVPLEKNLLFLQKNLHYFKFCAIRYN